MENNEALAKAIRDGSRMIASCIFFGVSVWMIQQGGPLSVVVGIIGFSFSILVFILSY
jgi:hypothetical protein